MPCRRSWVSCWTSGSVSIDGVSFLGLLEVLRSAHVLVRQVQGRLSGRGLRRLDERAHGAIAVAAECHGALAGTLESLRRVVARQAQDALSTAQGLFRVLASGGLLLQDLEGGGADGGGTLEHISEVVLDDRDVALWPMRIACAAPTTLLSPRVRGNELARLEQLHHVGADADVELLADQPIWHRVISATDLDVVVRVHLSLLPLAELVLPGRQRAKRRTIELDKARLARAVELLEGSVVELLEQLVDRRVQLPEGEEGAVTQARQDPTFDHEYARFDLRLVAGLTDPG